MKTYFVDSFTNQKFKGNPAAVCMLENDLENATMQSIATEIGFSETAFIKHKNANKYSIRFFTPKMEIPLCGHATLAVSKVLFEIFPEMEKIDFENIQGLDLNKKKQK